ncbi:MAG: UDP-N-acetylmuramoyl-L-alanyl-D-glutamate--2,6-diaminopimelate ligase [Candidatus Omnitrophica bacterium]|nr:UDP-N-acetylmuramoyl-L-alanyl-D-glutamate--2,6-diaminopimelate ligase [Candidatus Omnitrophota bacterium]
MLKLKEILIGVRYKTDSDISDLTVNRITNDSRRVAKGDLFIALRGYNIDGYEFIKIAIKKGARVIVSERDFKSPKDVIKVLVKDTRAASPLIAANFYGNPSKKMSIAGVTGTNGKTTITYIIENILKEAGKTSGVIGTINYRIGRRQFPSNNTTPGPLELQALFDRMRKHGVKYVVMEVSSHSLDQGRANGVLFDVGIFTNITKEHLDYHKTIKRYFSAKVKLFDKLKPGGVAVLNNDDPMVSGLKSRIKEKVLTYGLRHKSDVMACGIKLSVDSTFFTVKTPKGSIDLSTRLIGRHNVSNILASVAAAMALKIPLSIIKKGIELFSAVPGRLELVDEGQQFKVFVDYAHTEDALYNVLSLLREVVPDRNIITVFGCGGNRDSRKRPLMGNVACKFSDSVVVTSDNPRFEDPGAIISQIESGIRGAFSNYDVVEDRREAIDKALRMASKGDVVVIAGKGHEKYQIIKEDSMPFDDCVVARSVLKKII